MAMRFEDWLKQAKRDLEHAKRAKISQEYDWACFAAQQAAEKAVKALYQKLGADAWGHSVSILLGNFPEEIKVESSLIDMAKELDKHYIATRYPNFHPTGAPFEFYTLAEAERAIKYANEIISFCEDKIF